MADLTDVPTDELVKEMQRRLSCQTKPERHIILIGEAFITREGGRTQNAASGGTMTALQSMHWTSLDADIISVLG